MLGKKESVGNVLAKWGPNTSFGLRALCFTNSASGRGCIRRWLPTAPELTCTDAKVILSSAKTIRASSPCCIGRATTNHHESPVLIYATKLELQPTSINQMVCVRRPEVSGRGELGHQRRKNKEPNIARYNTNTIKYKFWAKKTAQRKYHW